MSGLLQQIEDHLIAEGVVDTGWSVCKGFLPPDGDQVIALFETSGEAPDIIPDPDAYYTEQAYDNPGFQVRVRGLAEDYEGPRNKIFECFRALHGNEPASVSGEPVVVCLYAVNSGPLPLGVDGSNRHGFTWNFRCKRERET